MRVCQLIANDNQGIFPTVGSFLQNIVNGKICPGSRQRNNALVSFGGGHHIQLSSVYRHYHRTGLLCLGSQSLQALIRFTGGNEHLINSSSAAQRFGQRISALQLPLVFFHKRLFFTTTIIFFHKYAPFPESKTSHNIIVIVTDFPSVHNCFFSQVPGN